MGGTTHANNVGIQYLNYVHQYEDSSDSDESSKMNDKTYQEGNYSQIYPSNPNEKYDNWPMPAEQRRNRNLGNKKDVSDLK